MTTREVILFIELIGKLVTLEKLTALQTETSVAATEGEAPVPDTRSAEHELAKVLNDLAWLARQKSHVGKEGNIMSGNNPTNKGTVRKGPMTTREVQAQLREEVRRRAKAFAATDRQG